MTTSWLSYMIEIVLCNQRQSYWYGLSLVLLQFIHLPVKKNV